MSNYTDSPNSCRVDFFKRTGKWYATEAVVFDNDLYKDKDFHAAFREALKRHLKTHNNGNPNRVRLSGMVAICLEPYVEHSHPVSYIIPEKWEDFDEEEIRDDRTD